MKGWVGLVATCSWRLTHVSGHPLAAGRAQDRESPPAKDRRFVFPDTSVVLMLLQTLLINEIEDLTFTDPKTNMEWVKSYGIYREGQI